ncbi:MAG: family 43 glycosylhydrolase, partial [Thermoguttaceae bacterium]
MRIRQFSNVWVVGLWTSIVVGLPGWNRAVHAQSSDSGPQTIVAGAIWPDDRGKHVQAHGGGIIKLGDTYYWFGEERARGLDRTLRYVSCYSSKDLAHWTFHKDVIKTANPDPQVLGTSWILERPKVYYNAKTKKFVMYMHLDGNGAAGGRGGYSVARVGIATCDSIDGDYKFLKDFRPLGQQSRDIGQFIDDDGTAYL